MSADFVYLASGSPRRRELLTQIGVAFRLLKVAVDETAMPGEAPQAYVERLARQKAHAGWRVHPVQSPAPVLAADTTVVVNGNILQKPADESEAVGMLCELSGRTHEVLTAIALADGSGLCTRLSRSAVTFRVIGADEARRYCRTGEPRDKAGGYAIQGAAAVFVAELRGSFSGVMGLPLYETAELLDLAGVPRWMSVDEH